MSRATPGKPVVKSCGASSNLSRYIAANGVSFEKSGSLVVVFGILYARPWNVPPSPSPNRNGPLTRGTRSPPEAVPPRVGSAGSGGGGVVVGLAGLGAGLAGVFEPPLLGWWLDGRC